MYEVIQLHLGQAIKLAELRILFLNSISSYMYIRHCDMIIAWRFCLKIVLKNTIENVLSDKLLGIDVMAKCIIRLKPYLVQINLFITVYICFAPNCVASRYLQFWYLYK